jgi:hypothetical protein
VLPIKRQAAMVERGYSKSITRRDDRIDGMSPRPQIRGIQETLTKQPVRRPRIMRVHRRFLLVERETNRYLFTQCQNGNGSVLGGSHHVFTLLGLCEFGAIHSFHSSGRYPASPIIKYGSFITQETREKSWCCGKLVFNLAKTFIFVICKLKCKV